MSCRSGVTDEPALVGRFLRSEAAGTFPMDSAGVNVLCALSKGNTSELEDNVERAAIPTRGAFPSFGGA
jgi:hypothetical protein